jgi:hypothetical protein
MAQREEITTPSGFVLRCEEISENDRHLRGFALYCKRYWGTQMKDYGTSRLPEADKYIDDHKLVWKEQAERSRTQDDAEGNGSPDEDRGILENTKMSKDDATHLSDVASMENSATNVDYHESCRILYATPLSEGHSGRFRDPVLIRAEYPRLYDRLKFLHSQKCKVVLTGQPGIGNLPCTVSHVVNITNCS